MDIKALRSFLAVAKHRSFSRAATSVKVTQPALSKRVAGLEHELGVTLFHRVARRISLTDAGERLLVKAQDLVAQADDMQRYAASLNKEISGTLAISIAHHIGLYRMPPILREFNQRFPEVMLAIRFEDSDQALRSVEASEIEFAVLTLPESKPAPLEMEVIWPDPLEVVVGRDHRLAGQSRIQAKALFAQPCILPEQSTETHQIVRRAAQAQGAGLQVQMVSNNLQSLKMLIAAGIGWSALPTTMLDSTLVTLDCGLQLQRNLGVVSHPQRSMSNAAQAMIALIRASIETNKFIPILKQ